MTETIISSATKEVVMGFDRPFVIIGERINPTGRKLLAAEMAEGDYSRVESDALAQVEAGAHMLDVNAGIPMADTRSSFFAPVLFGDTITIHTSVKEFRRSSFDIRHEVMKDDVLVAEGNETRIWTLNAPERPGGMKASPLPEEFVKRLSGEPD